MINAADSGQLHILQWMREQQPPCPWDDHWTCTNAASSGYLHILQWLREQQPPCPWSHWTFTNAASEGHLHVLQWLREQQPPYPCWMIIDTRHDDTCHLHTLGHFSMSCGGCVLQKSCIEGNDHKEVVEWLQMQQSSEQRMNRPHMILSSSSNLVL
jgi:hypothetical protein